MIKVQILINKNNIYTQFLFPSGSYHCLIVILLNIK